MDFELFRFSDKKIYALESGICITQLKQDILKIDLVSVLEKRKGVGTCSSGIS